MPYKLRKAPRKDLYWVVTIETGKKHSKEPILLEKAKAQMRILESALKGGISWNPGIEDYTNTGLLASCEAAHRDPNHAACQALKARIGVYKEPSGGPVQAVGLPGLNPSPQMAIEDRGTPQPQWDWRTYSKPIHPEPIGIQMGGKKRLHGGGYWTDEFYKLATFMTNNKEFIDQVSSELKEELKKLPSSYFSLGFDTRKEQLVKKAVKKLASLIRSTETTTAPQSRRNKRITEHLASMAQNSGTGKSGGATCKAPYHDYSKGKASVFALTCIDPRYTYDAAYFLQHKKELHQDYDLFTLAGSSVGVLKKEWTKTFFDNLELGLKLHGITEVWCFDHLDCGMYKATFGLDKDLDPKIHIDCMEKLKKLIKKKHPELKFRSFLIDSQGHISPVNEGGARKIGPKKLVKNATPLPGVGYNAPKRSVRERAKELYYVNYKAYRFHLVDFEKGKPLYDQAKAVNDAGTIGVYQRNARARVKSLKKLKDNLKRKIDQAKLAHDDAEKIQFNEKLLDDIREAIIYGENTYDL